MNLIIGLPPPPSYRQRPTLKQTIPPKPNILVTSLLATHPLNAPRRLQRRRIQLLAHLLVHLADTRLTLTIT